MSKQKLVFAFLVALFACGSTFAQAPLISIPVADPDFEVQPITGYVQTITDPAGCGTAEQGQVAGWTFLNGAGGGGGVAAWTCDDGMPPSNVAFLAYGTQGTSITQVLTEKARQGVYVLQFDVANWFYSYPGDWNAMLYQASLDPNGNVVDMNGNRWTLSPAPFCSASGWALGDMKRMTVTCPMPGYFLETWSPDPLSVGGQNPGGNIAIRFQTHSSNPALGGHVGWPILIDNVFLGFSPQL